MTNPLFAYFRRGRSTTASHLYNPAIARIKEYSSAARIDLPEPQSIDSSFSSLLRARISESDFSNTKIDAADLSTILFWSAGELGQRRDGQGFSERKMQRAHPSGGAMYPLELYVALDADTGMLARGMYHYRPDLHALEHIRPMMSEEMYSLKQTFGYAFVKDAPALVFLSFILERGMPKYGALAYKLGLIEAGHVGQNIYLAAAHTGLRCTALGGFAEEYVEELCGVDGYNESLFLAYALGKGMKKEA